MKFTVQKSVLLDNLTPAMGSVSNKNTITSIEGVLLETLEDGRIRLSTYDMNKGVRSVFTPSDIEREGKFIINASRLYQTVRVMPEDDITIEVNDNLNCTLSCGRASFSMFAMRGEEFPALPELVSERGFEVSASAVKKMISKVSHSIAELDNRPMLRGAFFNIKEGVLEVVSCDGYTLSMCEMKCDLSYVGNGTDTSFIIPGHALPELVKIIGDGDEKVTFYLTRKHAIVRREDTVFFTRTIDSEYIDYKRMLPRDNDIFVTVERERLLSGLERANIIAEEKIQGSGKSYVKLITGNDILILSSTSVNGKVVDEMECIKTGGDIEIGFNCRYLINSIRASEGEKILITMKGTLNAITVECADKVEDFKYFYMILPLRMNDANR
ncbi:MAG: DNA polymerase III subunit beta [Clostridia bacterium]|nr:DNA polymerase III subunit beta [Clostridia bacterium]